MTGSRKRPELQAIADDNLVQVCARPHVNIFYCLGASRLLFPDPVLHWICDDILLQAHRRPRPTPSVQYFDDGREVRLVDPCRLPLERQHDWCLI